MKAVRKTLWLPVVMLLLASMLGSCIIGKPKVLGALNGYPASEGVRVPVGTMMILGRLAGAGDDYSEYGGKVKTVEAFECTDAASAAAIAQDVAAVVRERRLELLLETRSAGETTAIYALMPKGDGTIIRELLIHSSEGRETDVVFLRGKFDLSKFMEDKLE